MSQAKDRAQQLLELAQRSGAEAVEVYQMQTRSQMACFDANTLRQIEHRESSGLALRLWQDSRPGLAVTRGEVDLSGLVEQAIALSQLSRPQDAVLALTHLCSPTLDRGKAVTPDQLIRWGNEAIASILSQNSQCACSAELSCESEDVYLINSRGLECGYVDTTLRNFLTTEWIRGHDFLCIEANQTQRDHLDPTPLIERISRGLNWSRRLATAPYGQVPILLTANATEVIWDAVQAALNSQKVVDEVSPWSHQLNQPVISTQLTLTQRPDFGPYSCPFDDEGIPSQVLDLVKKGHLQSFFTDQEQGQVLGIQSTGNGFRPHLHCYPMPELINLVIHPGDQALADLIAQMDNGLIVDQVLGENCRISGDLSFNVDLGYRVRHGTVLGRVKDTLVTGNVYQALNQLIALGNDNQWNDIYYSPSLLVSGFSVIPHQNEA